MRARIHRWLIALAAPRRNPRYESAYAAGYVAGLGDARAEAHRLKAAQMRQETYRRATSETLTLPTL